MATPVTNLYAVACAELERVVRVNAMFWRWRPTPPWGTDMLAKVEEREFHEDAVTRFQDDLNRLATPLIHALHADRLDGKVGGRFFEEKSAEWREEQRQIQRSID